MVNTTFTFFFNETATTEIYTYRCTLSLPDSLPISKLRSPVSSLLMFCRLFRDTRRSGPFGDERNIPVHFAIDRDVSYNRQVVRFQTTIEVMQLDPRQFSRHIIKKFRRDRF